MVYLDRLPEPIHLQNGEKKTTIRYFGIAQDMEQLNPYFNCDAYDGNNSVYVLDDNGFKLFNSNQVELIKGHNVFSVLQNMKYLHNSSFDKTKAELEEKGCSYSNAVLDGTEYFYGLKRMENAEWILIFLVSAEYVATNTLKLVNFVMVFIVIFTVIVAVCVMLGISFVMLRNKLDEIRAMALNIYMEQSAVRDGVTAEEVKGILLGMASGQETLLGYFRRFIRNFEKRVGINRTVGSLRAYSNAYSHIERIMQAQYTLNANPFSA